MKSFRFRYARSVWVLLVIVAILSIAGLAWNVFNLIEFLPTGSFKVGTYSLIVLLNLALTILVISLMLYGRYVIKNGKLYSYFGFICSKINVDDIICITHFKKSDKLVAYFKEGTYTVIVISPQEYDDFVKSIREINRSILFNAKIDGEDTPN
ncbi:MAG: hypothetical protein E7347_00040 [Clostridiales bacterium]|nr:hypothetical protein [Clostridiales bacterium]